jgi:phosphatidylglycerol:prolipoprotein diacylglycerol transferase
MYVDDLSPYMWRISGDFGIRWYGFSYFLGFILGLMLLQWLVARQKTGMTSTQVWDFATYCIVGALVGGRLGYCLFYSPDLFIRFKSDFPFWGVLALNDGGMSSHGGMIGLAIAAILYSMSSGISRLYLFDLVTVGGPIGVFFGRIANFMNGELVGRPCDPGFPLAVKFPTDIYEWPKDNFEMLSKLGEVISKLPNYTREKWQLWVESYRMSLDARESVRHGLADIVHSIQDGNAQVRDALAPLLTPRHPSQLYAAVGEGLFIFIVLFLLWYKPRRPGFITATFIVLYATVRIIDECFRMPDSFIGFQLFGLTRGQWLSIGMMLIGFVLMFLWSRNTTLMIPGWGRGHSVKLHRK